MEDYNCNECNGTGNIERIISKVTNSSIWYENTIITSLQDFCDYNIGDKIVIKCDKCQGSGKLNWTENIFGKKENIFSFGYNNNGKIPEILYPRTLAPLLPSISFKEEK